MLTPSNYKKGIANILNGDGDSIGTGFLYKGVYVVTCSHIFNEYPINDIFNLCFWVSDNTVIQSKASIIRRSSLKEDVDVGILKLIDGSIEQLIQSFSLKDNSNDRVKELMTFGSSFFSPEIHEAWADGIFMGEVTRIGKRRNYSMIQSNFPNVQSGFSGAPVWDTTSDKIVGIITESYVPQEEYRNRDTTWIIPISVIKQVIEEVENPSNNIDSNTIEELLTSFLNKHEVKEDGLRSILNKELLSILNENKFSFKEIIDDNDINRKTLDFNSTKISSILLSSEGLKEVNLEVVWKKNNPFIEDNINTNKND